MKTDAFETDLRQALGRRAAQVPGEAIQRLERRDYWPPSRTRRAMAAAGLVSATAAGAAAGPRRRTMLAGGAAAVILLGGAGYGLTAAFAGHAAGPAGSTKTAALTAVKGCARLAQVTGTFEQVNGTALVIQTPSGQSVTVTTTASTRVSLSAAPLSDITVGAYVRVDGVDSDGTIAAGKVAVGELPSGKPQPPGGKHTLQTLPGGTIVQGTVADATSVGFTVDTSAGTQVPVTTFEQHTRRGEQRQPGRAANRREHDRRRLRRAGWDSVGNGDSAVPVDGAGRADGQRVLSLRHR